jgi:AcrR family transcriptional regulator
LKEETTKTPVGGLTSLQAAALETFAEKGFSAASMSQIAEAAGMRKSSLYSHFDSKESLYLSLVRPAMDRELALFESSTDAKGVEGLRLYLLSFGRRRRETPPFLRFLLAVVYSPPEQLQAVLKPLSTRLYLKLHRLTKAALAALTVPAERLESLTQAYLGVVDSVQVIHAYYPKLTNERLKALWALFSAGLEGALTSPAP